VLSIGRDQSLASFAGHMRDVLVRDVLEELLIADTFSPRTFVAPGRLVTSAPNVENQNGGYNKNELNPEVLIF
jgi:hypothetical protein